MSSKLPKYIRPSPYTPFLRRFTDERALDLAETQGLYQRVRTAFQASIWSNPETLAHVSVHALRRMAEVVDLPDSEPILDALVHCQNAVLELETTIFGFPEIDWDIATLSLKEQVDLRRCLRAQEYFLAHEDRIGEALVTALGNVFGGLIASLPPMGDDKAAQFTVPLLSRLQNPGDVVDRVIGTLLKQELADAGLFTALQQRLYENVCRASGVSPTDEKSRKPLITADESKLPPAELIETYLGGTPFADFLQIPVPFSLPEQARFEHHWIVAGSGHGKTQLLQHLILSDLQSPEPPALIVIDSQGEMLRKIERLALFRDSDRLVIIDPEDDAPPALNLFDMSTDRLQGYSRLVREQVEAGIVELYNYIFGALAADLTSKQGTAFAFVTRLMLSIPGATIHTLRELMEENAKTLNHSRFADAIAALDPTARAFFENQFYSNNAFAQTRQQLARRLYGVVQVPAFDRMLSAQNSKIDMFEAMQSGKVVLVNTSKSLLKTEASALFGRFMIAQALRAAYERVAVPERERRPAFLVIDEASEYFDDSLETLLNQARKFNLGIVFAHQYLDQLDPKLRASVAANTSIKMAGGLSDRDARALSPDMRTSPEFLNSQRKHNGRPPQWSEFACYIRNHTASAVSLRVPFFSVENAPTISTAEHDLLRERNRQRYATVPATTRPAAVRPVATGPVTPPPGADQGDDWRS